MVLRYTNNSPDTLKTFWFQTEQRSEVIERFDQIVQGKPVTLVRQHPDTDLFELQVTPARPLPPGQTTTFHVEWHFDASGGTTRMGRDEQLYQMGQWYPRPNVYDDVKGWNTESYATNAEFYLEYGDFRLEVTLPAGYIVAATGTLDNPKQVLTATEITRLAQAAKADTVVPIITAEELKSGAARPTRAGMLTWKFHAANVRDVAWASSPDYVWDATSWHGIIAQSYYRPSATMWHDAADMARMSIQEFSERWFPYPYPQISVTEGPVLGMEYPMLSFDVDMGAVAQQAQQAGLAITTSEYQILTHEIGHNWFPMIVGSNERMHTWQDEGFNTFIDAFSEARRDPGKGDQSARIGRYVFDGRGTPLETGAAIGNSSDQYSKTAYVLQLLRRDVLGPDLFDKGFRTYIQRWAYKHPTPMDFFRTMEDVSGRKLDWFWRTCFLEAPRLDQTIDSVSQTIQGTETHVTVTYANKGRAVMPLFVRFTFSDSTTQDVTYPADVWKANPSAYTVSYTFPKKTASHIVLDPNIHLPDADRSNNIWTAK
jgi:aminopeptidase N